MKILKRILNICAYLGKDAVIRHFFMLITVVDSLNRKNFAKLTDISMLILKCIQQNLAKLKDIFFAWFEIYTTKSYNVNNNFLARLKI